jgi:hypothetical protein
MLKLVEIVLHVVSFLTMVLISLALCGLTISVLLGITMFLTWTVPAGALFHWGILRGLVVISIGVSLCWAISSESKEWVDESLETLKNGPIQFSKGE